MSTTETVRAWSTTAASNNTSDAAITSADTQSPDTLDNNVRSIMAAVKKQENDTGGNLAAGGTANALTVTTNQVLESGQLVAGLFLSVRATADNTSATVTFAPDGLTAANIKRADGSALAIGSIKSGMPLELYYNAGSSEWRCANIAPLQALANISSSGTGLILLTSGTVAAATLDILLTSYTAYRGLKFFLSGFLPNADNAALYMRFSSSGGAGYNSAAYRSDWATIVGGVQAIGGTSSAAQIQLTDNTANAGVGNATNEGYNGEITMLNQTSTAHFTRIHHMGCYLDPLSIAQSVTGSGALEVAQDTDAVRFLFSSGNIAAGNYAVYGLA